jgi:4a-hydroxytetrahydrobiopterin dehydratase
MTQALTRSEIETLCHTVAKKWTPASDHQTITQTFKFKDHYATMAFVNAVAWISHQHDHHPEMVVGYNTCTVTYSTHEVNGLSHKDFDCAALIDQWF